MIIENPFYILDATTRDNRQKIVELAEEKSFEIDEELCQKARSDLTVPRNRILAELNWLPGVSPKKASSFISQLKSNDKGLYSIEGIPNLARINILMELLDNEYIKFTNSELEQLIIKIVDIFENLNTTEIIRDINEDRIVSGFPEINDNELLENHLSEKKRYCIKLILKRLNSLDTMNLIDIMTKIVDDTTFNGDIQASAMIEDLVDDYKLHTQNFLEQEFEKIKKLIEVIRERADKGKDTISSLIDKLIEITKNWDNVAQPIQLSMKSRGLDESLSNDVAYTIRSLGIDLTNDYGYIELSQKISEVLKELFAELPGIVEQVENDIDQLDNLSLEIKEARKRKEEKNKEYEESLNYSAEIGLVFKDKLIITPQYIEWQGKKYFLESIIELKWGAVSHSINGIPTGTIYSISIGDDKSNTTIETRKSKVYKEVIEILWKSVGIRIMIKILEDLKKGKFLQFGTLKVWDTEVELLKRGSFFTADETKKFKWNQVEFYSMSGFFIIKSINDNSFYKKIPYLDVYNLHFLEQILTTNKKYSKTKLSDILD